MESTLTGVVESVTGRTTRTGPIYDVVIGGQKVSTFKQPIAEEANALQGSTVEARVSVEQKGDYTNYTLLGVKLVDAAPTTANGIPLAPATSPIPVNSNQFQRDMSPETAARVTRLACLSTAFHYAGVTGDSVEDALSLAKRLYGVAMGTETPEPVETLTAAPAAVDDGVPW